MDPLLVPLTALAAGALHALEADHMAAVTTFVSRRPGARAAAGFGLRWGLGHSAAVAAAGTALAALRLRVPDGVARGLEFGVGAMLLGLGLWLLWSALHARAHRLAGDDGAHHAHGSGWVGLAHGLAGTAPLLAVLPAATASSPLRAAAWLLLFGVGTTAAMAAYALAAGLAFRRAGARHPRLGGALRAATALASAALGVVWMHAALGGA